MAQGKNRLEGDQKTGVKWLRRIWGVLPVLLLVLVIWGLGGAVSGKRKSLEAAKLAAMAQEIPAINVVTMPLTPGPIKDRINLPGIIKPWVNLTVRAEVRGKVLAKKIIRGTVVNQKDIIAVIDSRDYRNALQSATASYDAALSSKKRLEKLFGKDLATRSQLDDAVAQVEGYKALMDTAQLNLDRCTVRSPISGVVNQLYFENGQYLNVADPIADVLQLDKVKVNIGIPESDVSAVGLVDIFEVKIDALDGKIFSGKKHFLSSATDPMARLYDLELVIDNPAKEILPDMFARVEIVKSEVADALAIPLYSVISLKDSKLVYVEKDGAVESRHVKLGLQEGWRIQVTDGLVPGDNVVVVGQRSVNDGQKVNVIRQVDDIEELAR